MGESLKKVQELLKLPQELCNTCGMCCKAASFKGGLSYEEILELANSTTEDPSQIDGAKDFLSIFVPFNSTDEARKVAGKFVDETMERLGNPNMSFFYCKYLSDKNLCKIHEDRPLLCRMYPIPHERTMYHPMCGFKQKGEENWKKIEQIIHDLEQQAAKTAPNNQ